MRSAGIDRRVLGVVAAVAAVLMFTTACEPLVNAPPGGGATITKTFRHGPFTLGPGGEVEGSPTSGMPRPAGAFGLKSAKFDIVDQNNVPIGKHEIHLHHVVMTTSARQDQLCPNRPERFIGSGAERTPINLWGPYTYLVGANDQWGSIYHLMNETPAGTPAKTFYLQYTLTYQPGANATNSRPVDAYFNDVTGCGGSTFDVPGNGGPGSVYSKSAAWTAPRDGLAVFAGGHYHDGGVDITLKNNTTNTTLCTGSPTYHEDPRHLAAISSCVLHEKVTAGNSYGVTVRYENSEPLADVMGIYMTYVWWGTQ